MSEKPGVIVWFNVYLGVMVFFCLLMIAGGIGMWFLPDSIIADMEMTEEDRIVFEVYKYLLPVIGVISLVMNSIPFFVRPRPWVWVYNIVLLALSMGSCMFIPALILLIFWLIKPEVKWWYSKDQNMQQPPYQSV